jgi:P pilus assembly chaperone PapD
LDQNFGDTWVNDALEMTIEESIKEFYEPDWLEKKKIAEKQQLEVSEQAKEKNIIKQNEEGLKKESVESKGIEDS